MPPRRGAAPMGRITAATRVVLGACGSRLHPKGLAQSGTLKDHDLLVVLSGTMVYRLGVSGPETLGPGQGLLLWPGQHCATEMKTAVHLAWFHFHLTAPGAGLMCLPPPPRVPSGQVLPEIISVAMAATENRPGSKQRLEGALWLGLEDAWGAKAFAKGLVLEPVQSVPLKVAVEQILMSRPPDSWSLAEVAWVLGLSANHMGEKFRLETGVPYLDFIWEKRLQAAAPLMAAGKTLAEVAQAAGYSDAFSFSHAFKRRVGQPPRGYGQSRPRPKIPRKSHNAP